LRDVSRDALGASELRGDAVTRPPSKGAKAPAKAVGASRKGPKGGKFRPKGVLDMEPEPIARRPKSKFGNDDVGNAERLVAHFGPQFRYVPKWGEFLTWKSTHWHKDVEGLALMGLMKAVTKKIRQEAKDLGEDKRESKRKKALFAWAVQSRSRSRLEAAISLAKSEDGVCVDLENLDKNTWLFNCRSGTIDLKTGQLRKHAQRDLLTKVSPVKFDAAAKAPRWEKWLEQILPSPEVRDYLQRFIGYCLTGEVNERQFVICFGQGRNGKSLLINVLRYILGPYCGPMAPGLLMARDNEAHPAEVADLFGLRLATSSETKQGRAFDEEQLKRMTGNEELKARLMRENWWTFFPTHKLLMAVNHKPRVKDVTESFWDRAALIPFNVRIEKSKVDKDLFQKLKAEGAGILAWMVRGCLEWQKRGLDMPDEVRQATEEYRENEDILGRFIKERLAFGKGLTKITLRFEDGTKKTVEAKFEVSNQHLSTTSANWCKRLNLFPIGERALAERLTALGAERATHVGASSTRGWRGVRVLDQNEDTEQLSTITSITSITSPVPAKSELTNLTPSNVIPFASGKSGRSDAKRGRVSQVIEVIPAKRSVPSPSNEPNSRGKAQRRSPVRPPRGSRPRGRGRKRPAS
jgi:putative DNA primase/helicase